MLVEAWRACTSIQKVRIALTYRKRLFSRLPDNLSQLWEPLIETLDHQYPTFFELLWNRICHLIVPTSHFDLGRSNDEMDHSFTAVLSAWLVYFVSQEKFKTHEEILRAWCLRNATKEYVIF